MNDELQESLIHACILKGDGSQQILDWDGIANWSQEQGTLWMHLDYTAEKSIDWLRKQSGLDSIVIDSLLAEETRPRCAVMGGGLQINLRGVNTNPNSNPEDMVSIRIFCDGQRFISTRKRRLLSIQDIITRLNEATGPKNPGELLTMLTHRLTARMSEIVSDLDDAVDGVEEQIIDAVGSTQRGHLVRLRREIIMLRRYLSPQREALTRLLTETAPWLNDRDRLAIREAGDRVSRYLEDLDSCRDRAAVAYEELASRVAEQMNSRMYVLSIVAALFLPLGFLTGMFGINVGGVPFAEDPMGFIEISLILIAVVIAQVVIFRFKKWF
jgi:zinc transporter